MDQVDLKIVLELQMNARISMTELGQRVGLTAPATAERVKKLEDRGVIEAYRAKLSAEAFNKRVTAYILFETERCKAFAEFCKEHPEVMECHRLAGQYSYLVKLVTESVQTLEAFIDNAMPYGKSSTHIQLSSPVDYKSFR
ncbi:Lrp/AsnC family transcriptional regulator [Paenibacillus sp. GCM10023248]|uniref:Lrp/AsnC family transcriptional regulator n=1 Tax=Bacillales TaxID=1385 RepID=UPI0023789DB8|nr:MULTISPECIES: Lrp/AsnC family transcriptional regulator [Bacillales]MDD9269270.1 Lrp/AsnC family transcriptional regulator [Paenibacillus sp. MAHUQ-63]MDR6880506.1 DNA-binding Lrp family transcriptional regulator [Bacillus sp. 3255]